jgi:hypothetical protein
MSSSSPSKIQPSRRQFAIGLGALALAAMAASLPAPARAEDVEDIPSAPPPHITAELGSAHLYGAGLFRYFGFHIYDAFLWVGPAGFSPDNPYAEPFALDIRYARKFKGSAINQTTIDEWERLDIANDQTRHAWIEKLDGVMPDVVPDQHLTGIFSPTDGWKLYSDGKLVGAIQDVAFAKAFFAIWLDPRTKAPALRQHMLNLPAT